jgi:hypothetical protein
LGNGGFVVLALLEANWEPKKDQPGKLKKLLKGYEEELEGLVKAGTGIIAISEKEEDREKRRKAISANLLLEALAK